MKSKIKVSILSHDLSENCLGRAYILAKILKMRYEVEIIGPLSKKGLWEPVEEDKSIKYKFVKRNLNFKEISSLIDGDLIYAIKPKGTSFGYGLIKKLKTRVPLILDIDDWEMGFYHNPLYMLYSLAHFWDPNNALYTFVLEKLVKKSDGLTVSNSFLNKRFGGKVIPHVKDTQKIKPCRKNTNNLKSKLGIENKKVVLFFGTIRKHKGIEDLINSIKMLNRRDTQLLIVGADLEDSYVRKLIQENNKNVLFIGKQPLKKVQDFLSIANVVVIPQRESNSSIGQIPAKLFDAMAMGKPIISTNVSDIPKVLDGCGIIVEPEKPDQLAEKIKYVFDNPKFAKNLGKKAREKCIKEYSFDAVKGKLFKLVEENYNKYRVSTKPLIKKIPDRSHKPPKSKESKINSSL